MAALEQLPSARAPLKLLYPSAQLQARLSASPGPGSIVTLPSRIISPASPSIPRTRPSNMSDYEDVVDSEPPAIEPYEVLGLERDATADQIKSAYRKAALKNHPGTPLHRTAGYLL